MVHDTFKYFIPGIIGGPTASMQVRKSFLERPTLFDEFESFT